MENRCQRCDRVLSDPNAVFGWRCAEILGVSGELSKMGADIFRKFVDGVMKAQKLQNFPIFLLNTMKLLSKEVLIIKH